MKKLTVIGAGGQMGQWFTKYFAGSDFEVTGYDQKVKVSEKISSIRIISGCNSKSRLCSLMYTNKKNTRNYQINCKRDEKRNVSN